MPSSHLARIPAAHLGRRPEPERRLRLLERVRANLKTRHYSPRTEEAYCDWVRRFVLFHQRRHPSTMGEREIAAFLNDLATVKNVSASTQNQALHALLFLYRHVLRRNVGRVGDIAPARRGRRLPTVLSFGEVRSILTRMRGVPRLCASLMYGSGLRLSECTQLRVKDIDFERAEIVVRCGKGDRDRRVPLPRMAVPALRAQLERTHRRFEQDLRGAVSGAALPHAVARKLPNAERDWGWQYVFPAARVYIEKESGKRRRHHLHETAT
jgi:integron integrase